MPERPIIFSAPMVRAILAGRKTQTRRVLRGLQPSDQLRQSALVRSGIETTHGREVRIPYCIGDTLWVRETWSHSGAGVWTIGQSARALDGRVLYRADNDADGGTKWWPSIHMPRWASRITLRVTDVRVQRLQDITEEDARAEGAKAWADERLERPSPSFPSARSALYELWDTIHGPDAWDANPWVVAVSFERIDA